MVFCRAAFVALQLTHRRPKIQVITKIRNPSPPPPACTRSFSITTIMSGVDAIASKLAGLSITPAATVSHASQSSPATWREALLAAGNTPKDFGLTKTLVFKPKTAKSAVAIPVVVIAREETGTNSAALGKKLNLKELRLASGDLLTELFSLDKDSCEFASLCSYALYLTTTQCLRSL